VTSTGSGGVKARRAHAARPQPGSAPEGGAGCPGPAGEDVYAGKLTSDIFSKS